MRKFVGLVVMVSLLATASANPNKSEKPIEISRDSSHRVLQVKKGSERLTTNWVFVVDSSHSTWKIAGRVLSGFRAATQMPLDELYFCTYVFNNQGCHKFRGWKPASVDEFNKTEEFVGKNSGVSSYAARAIREALCQPKNKLTLILISDGGFSDGKGRAGSTANQAVIKQVIVDSQKWRVVNGYNRAVIVTIGIENYLCWPRYPKSTNARCMVGMRDIGVAGEGGFYYVQELPKLKRKDHAQIVNSSSVTPG